jgi:hypothetical protein
MRKDASAGREAAADASIDEALLAVAEDAVVDRAEEPAEASHAGADSLRNMPSSD